MRHLDLLALLVLLAAYLPCYSVGQFQCLKNPPDALEFENNNSTAPRKCFLLLETNQTRCYYALVPDCAAGETSVMYDLHGRLGCPEDFVTYSGWGRKAVEECFIAIWPDVSAVTRMLLYISKLFLKGTLMRPPYELQTGKYAI